MTAARLTIAAALLSNFICGIFVGRGCSPKPPAVPATVIEYRDRPIAPKDMAGALTPSERIVYRTVTRTRTDTVRVPVSGPALVGMVTERPVQIKGGAVILTTWRPDSLRWEQERFTIPPTRFAATLTAVGGVNRALTAGGTLGPIRPVAGLAAAVRYKRLSVRGSTVISQSATGAVGLVSVGVGIELWGWRR